MGKDKKKAEQKPEAAADGAAAGQAAPDAEQAPEKAKKKERAKKRKRQSSPRRLLSPLIPLYRMVLNLREFRLSTGLEPVRWLRCPVISVGNLSTGGTGKTPFTIALAKQLASLGLPVDVLSRGYGRQSELVTRVELDGTAEEFGDEPLLIARETGRPVYVGAERYDAGILAENDALTALAAAAEAAAAEEALAESTPVAVKQGSRSTSGSQRRGRAASIAAAHDEDARPFCIHLLDDGFQHRQLARAVDILLLNEQDWEDRLLPAGDLREPLEALFRANAIAIPASEPELAVALTNWGWEGPIWRLRRVLDVRIVDGPVAAFCGIARPEQFFEGLESVGLELAAQFSFPDHYDYDESVVRELIASARAQKAKAIITTSKDLVRLGKLAELFPKTLPLEIAQLRIEIDDHLNVLTWLMNRLV
jgi:tetraacyldisaccharide 4'-kinase